MLDQDTKRSIDAARQVLVGRIPDPKAQVEQITTALIYKFMDDMDRQSEGLGAKANFLVGSLKEFGWGRLISKELSGQERLDLYIRAQIAFTQSEQIPELFRKIFKDAFLPYRDAETLNLFLKEINVFTYDHSENLGNAFEYLLSVLGSQGEAGQFRTPRHIIDFIVEVVDPKKNDTILDPACGTAGFLISSYIHIRRNNSSNYKPKEYTPSFSKAESKDVALVEIQGDGKYKGDKLNPDDRKRLSKQIIGYDISPDMVKLSLVNMYLHGFNTPQIYEYDTLTKEDRWDEHFDIILANPPFMSPKGGVPPHKRFQIQANRSEILFVDYIAEHLALRGRAGVIVPEGIIFQSSNACKNLRKWLIEDNYLWAVVSLPAGVFKPYSGVKTSILFLDRERAKKNDEILFVKVSNDGFDLGDQRRAISKNDLPEAYKILQNWQKDDKSESSVANWVEKKTILDSDDYNLTGDRYREAIDYGNVQWDLVKVGDVCEVISGQSPPGEFYNVNGEGTPFYQGKTEFTEKYIGSPVKWTTKVTKLAEPGDILMSVRAPVGPVNLTNSRICIGRGLAAIRAKDTIRNDYLFYILRERQDLITGNSGAAFASINRKDIQGIQVPLPPLEVQNDIVEELDGYQRVIDGARQVIDNWKPTVKIDPKWDMVRLGDISDNLDGKRVPIEKSKRRAGEYPYYGASGIVDYVDDFLFDEDLLLVSEDGANLTARVTPIAFSVTGKAWVNNHAHVLRFERLESQRFVELYLNSISLEPYITGSAQPKLNQKNLSSIPIPFPELQEQKQIVRDIDIEQKAIESAKKLIATHQRKIDSTIAEIWGA